MKGRRGREGEREENNNNISKGGNKKKIRFMEFETRANRRIKKKRCTCIENVTERNGRKKTNKKDIQMIN